MPTLCLEAMPGAVPCRASRDDLDVTLVGDPRFRATSQVATLADIRAAVQRFGEHVRTVVPDASFLVYVTLLPDGCKPPGYDAAYLNGSLGQQAFLAPVEKETVRREAGP